MFRRQSSFASQSSSPQMSDKSGSRGCSSVSPSVEAAPDATSLDARQFMLFGPQKGKPLTQAVQDAGDAVQALAALQSFVKGLGLWEAFEESDLVPGKPPK